MLCPNCETENHDDALFCDECGFPLSGALARTTGAASSMKPRSSDEEDITRSHSASSPEPKPEAPSWQEEQPSSQDTREYHWDTRSRAHDQTSRFQNDVRDANAYSNRDFAPSSQTDWDPLFEKGDTVAFDAVEEPAEYPDTPRGGDRSSAYHYDQLLDQGKSYRNTNSDRLEDEADLSKTLDFGDDFWRDDPPRNVQNKDKRPSSTSRDYRAVTVKRGMGGNTMAIIVVGALVAVAAVVAIVGFALGIWGGKIVPDVVGMTEADAYAMLAEEDFTAKAVQVKSDETEGLVLSTEPSAGSHAPEGSEVVIDIASARFVPAVEGKSEDEARRLFEEAGYGNVSYEPEYTDGEEGVVVSVSPEAGTRAKGSMEIIVKVSQNYRVPDISGQNLDAALESIESAGLVPNVIYIDSDQYPDGTIMGTDPEAGTKVSQGDYVSITVTRTRGIELVALTEAMFAEGETVTIGGVDYQIENVISMSYQGDDTVAYTATATPYVTFFGETLYSSSSQTISGEVVWSSDDEVISIS